MAWLLAVIGGRTTIQIQIYEESFFVGNPFEGPGWTGRACPCTIGSFGQTRFLTKGMKDLF